MQSLRYIFISLFLYHSSDSFSSSKKKIDLRCHETLEFDAPEKNGIPPLLTSDVVPDPLQTLIDYPNYQKISSIKAVLEKARERQEALGCEASDVLVCLDVDYFSVATNGGNDPLEACTVQVYKILMQEGFRVLRLTARGAGHDAPDGSDQLKILEQSNADLIKSLGDTSGGFPDRIIDIQLGFPASGNEPAKVEYGIYMQGTLFAGGYKADMLSNFLKGMSVSPKVIIMGDDHEGYLFDFVNHCGLMTYVGPEIHLLHMPLGTHVKEIVKSERLKVAAEQKCADLIMLNLTQLSAGSDE